MMQVRAFSVVASVLTAVVQRVTQESQLLKDVNQQVQLKESQLSVFARAF
jgi:hypothetical protein